MVAGKGGAVILINNRRITNQEELEMLNSQNIKRIEVIENPSARYEAEGHSVINIITRKNQEMGINANLQTNYTRGRHNSGNVSGSLSYVAKNIILFSQYGYTNRNSEGFNFSNEHFEKNGYSFHLKQDNLKNLYQTRINNYSFGINYNPSLNHSFGLKYDGFSGNVLNNTINRMEASRNDAIIPIEIMNEDGTSKSQNNGVNFNYNFVGKGYEIAVAGDYTVSKKNSFVAINETDINNTDNTDKENTWETKYDLFSAQTDAKFPIDRINSSFEIGARVSRVESENDSRLVNLLNGSYVQDDRFSSIISFDETIIGSYFLFGGKISDKTQYKAGLRYEHTMNDNNWISAESSGRYTFDNNFFPSLLLSHKVNDKLSFRLSYSKRITRPSYEALNNRILYINSYSVNQGNPFLSPAIYNTLSFSSQFNKLNLSLNLSHIKNPNDLLYLNDSIQIEKYTVKRINTENRWTVAFSSSYSYTYKKWTIQPFFNMNFSERSIIEDGIKYSVNYPGIYLSMRNNILLFKSIEVDFDFTYNKPAYSFKTFNDQYEFNLSVRKKLLKDKLNIQLYCNYIPTKWGQMLDYSYKYIDFVWDGDDRKQIGVSLRYNFNSAKRQFKSKSSNEEELSRM